MLSVFGLLLFVFVFLLFITVKENSFLTIARCGGVVTHRSVVPKYAGSKPVGEKKNFKKTYLNLHLQLGQTTISIR